MKKLFKPYLYSIIISGFFVFLYYMFFQTFAITYLALFFILALITCDYFEFVGMGDNAISMAMPCVLLLIIFFGPSVAMIGSMLSTIIVGISRYRKGFKDKMFDSKLFFNIGQFMLCIYIVSSVQNLINFNINNIELWKIFILSIVYHIFNTLFITLIISFMYGKWSNNAISVKDVLYYLYSTVLGLCLIMLFHYMGVIGAILLFTMFIPFLQTTVLYAKYKMREEELFTDELTKIYNYRFFENLIENKIKKQEKFSLMMLDLDKFKSINDTYGHSAGDQALIKFAEILTQNSSKHSYVCRYGGDEFYIITSDENESEKIAQNILKDIEKHQINFENNTIKLNCSIGIYSHINEGNETSFKDIVTKVDNAMYTSKKYGGNIITYYVQT